MADVPAPAGDVTYMPDVLTREIPGAQKRVLANAAHWVNLEQPAEFNEMVLEFLAEHPFR
jgi:pimeloyl-ACP methyl ester carboxylesterase